MHYSIILTALTGFIASSTASPTEPLVARGQPANCGGSNPSVPGINCFCSGAISTGASVWAGITEACEDWKGKVVPAHGEFHWVKGDGANNIEMHMINNCDHDIGINREACFSEFDQLKQTCAWTWDSHKGGEFQAPGWCHMWKLDVNGK
ncbi:hypothetical protein BGZ63DRAFT_203634 [Mariannaea sp. PMI_226]|nr:hypothetical protein BGZ63DRAFT_203634 [Mariannaea sp. PMI_226]